MLDATTPDVLNQPDREFLTFWSKESPAIAQALDADVRLVDLGADFRLTGTEAWTPYFGGDRAGFGATRCRGDVGTLGCG